MPRGRKPGSKNKPKTTIPTSITMDDGAELDRSLEQNLEEDTYKDSKTDVRETVISCIAGDNYCTIYSNERYWRNFCKRMLEEHPEDCTLVREYPEDGTIEIRMPMASMRYVRYPTKRELTEEQRQAASERGKKLGAMRKKQTTTEEDN